MSLKVSKILDIMEELAPAALKEDYDNVGLMVGDFNDDVSSILVALDCTMPVIDEAILKDCDLILTHHPLLFHKPETITNETLIGKKLLKLIKNDINVISSHTNLDSAWGGITDILMQLLGFNNYDVIESKGINGSINSGIGRIAALEKPVDLISLCDFIKKVLGISCIKYAGNEDMKIHKLAVINGSGEDYFSLAQSLGADCILTGDTTYHYVCDCVEQGMAVIDAGHFETEWPSMQRIAGIIENRIKETGYDCNIFISESNCSPYKYK